MKNLSNLSDFSHLKPGLHPSITEIVEDMNTLIQEKHNHRENCITLEVSRRTQKFIFTLQKKYLALHSLVRTSVRFPVGMSTMNLEWCWEHNVLTNRNLLTTLSSNNLSWYTRTWLSTTTFATPGPYAALQSFHLKAQSWRHYNYWTVQEVSDI